MILIKLNKKHREYILFDLEAIGENTKDDFMEIVEIAAHKVVLIDTIVPHNEYMRRKLDKQYLVLDSFHTYISPIFHSKINKKLNNLLHIDMETLKNSLSYEDALNQFLEWAGEDAIFISWSDSDRKMIEENNRYLLPSIPPYMKFEDLQKVYDRNYHKMKRTGLMTAVEEIGEKFEGKQHSAIVDSLNMLPILVEISKNVRKFQ